VSVIPREVAITLDEAVIVDQLEDVGSR